MRFNFLNKQANKIFKSIKIIIETNKGICQFRRLKKRCEARKGIISGQEYLTKFNLLNYIINQNKSHKIKK